MAFSEMEVVNNHTQVQDLANCNGGRSPLKQSFQITEGPNAGLQVPPQSLSSSPQEAGNDALIHRLLESLEAIGKKNGAPTATSEPLEAVSSEESPPENSEPAPPSPTGVITQLDHSPSETISREHSTDCLVAAVQQLTLQGRQGQHLPGYLLPNSTPVAPTALTGGNWNGTTMPMTMNVCMPVTTMNVGAVPIVGHGSVRPAQVPVPYVTTLQSGILSTSLQQQPQQALTGMGVPVGRHTPGQYTPVATLTLQQQALVANQQALPGYINTIPNLSPAAATAAVYGMQFAAMQDPRSRHMAQQVIYPEEVLVGLLGQYQPYCDQIITEELNSVTYQLLLRVKVLQLADPPAVSHILGKRYFCSLKEVSKVVQYAKALIVAPDVRASPTAHIKPVGLLQSVLRMAQAMGVPYVFALSRRGIGQVFGRDKNMSIVAVMQTEGVEAEYVQMLELAARGREMYSIHRGGRRF